MMKIVSVVGARPQFIKCAALSKELSAKHDEVIVHTGQHYDFNLSEVFFNDLDIKKPAYNLGIGSGTHCYQIGHMLMAIEEVLIKEKPGMTLVYGDTNSTLAAAIASSRLHIPIGHVEAGLRTSYVGYKGIPEEMNRILTDHCSDLLFCPTRGSVDNLKKENIVNGVYLTGDVMVDILLQQKKEAEKLNKVQELGLIDKQYIFVTVHREHNTDDPKNLGNIVDALCELNQTIVFPIHPRTEKALKKHGLYDKLDKNGNVKIITPLPYLESLCLIGHAWKVITDSGGVEKEAYILKVPCITMLETSPWIETVEDGWNVTVGSDKDKIVKMARNFEPTSKQTEDYGNGKACKNIVRAIGAALP
jgi:UDP-GlcNAc3NAcA epimerase